MKHEAKINYWVDVVIGIAFLAAAFSGLVLLFAGHGGGYRGGRNPEYFRSILFFTRDGWREFHRWSTIIMVVGVVGHFVLHWNWFVCMTRNLFKSKRSVQANPEVS
jgi:hypothetical protein